LGNGDELGRVGGINPRKSLLTAREKFSGSGLARLVKKVGVASSEKPFASLEETKALSRGLKNFKKCNALLLNCTIKTQIASQLLCGFGLIADSQTTD
jgi:hypothetical protein